MAADRKGERDDAAWVAFGSYPPPKAERLLDALVKGHVRFEIECDDGASFTTGRMGHFGMDSKIDIFIDPVDLKEAHRIQKDLFGDVIP